MVICDVISNPWKNDATLSQREAQHQSVRRLVVSSKSQHVHHKIKRNDTQKLVGTSTEKNLLLWKSYMKNIQTTLSRSMSVSNAMMRSPAFAHLMLNKQASKHPLAVWCSVFFAVTWWVVAVMKSMKSINWAKEISCRPSKIPAVVEVINTRKWEKNWCSYVT